MLAHVAYKMHDNVETIRSVTQCSTDAVYS